MAVMVGIALIMVGIAIIMAILGIELITGHEHITAVMGLIQALPEGAGFIDNRPSIGECQ